MSHLGEEAIKGWEINLPLEAQPEEAQAWPEYPGAESWPARYGHASQRGGKKITHIVIHAMWGSYEGSLSWFQSANNPYYTSAHYSVSKTGRVGQSVYEHLAAHHIGIHNGYTIGIEHEDNQQLNSPGWTTDVMLQTSAKLVAHLCQKYGIPIDREHIKGHVEFSGQDHYDPGKYWPWEKYMNLVKAYAIGPMKPPTAGATPDDILGAPQHSLEKVKTLIREKSGTVEMLALADSIYKYAPQKNIRPEVLSLQSALETGWGTYTGDTKPYNPAGIKTKDATGDEPWDFELPTTADEGGRMMVNHWCAVLGLDPIGTPHGRYALAKAVYADRRITKVSQLGNGNWATDPGYAKKLSDLIAQLGTATSGTALYKVKIEAQQQGAYSVRENAESVLSKLTALGVKATIEGGSGPSRPPTEEVIDVVPKGFKPQPVIPNGTWLQRHPTRYTWRKDIENLIRDLYKRFPGIHVNTYVDHPEGYRRDTTSLDVWKGHRGGHVGSALGTQVKNHIFFNQPIKIDWMIWEGKIWTKYYGVWQVFKDDGTGLHYDHVHVTFV